MFLTSGVASRFESGDFAVIVGMSGVELAYPVMEESHIPIRRIPPHYTIDRSEEYWVGRALAYYQWETALSFSEIVRAIPLCEIIALYSPYHEMDIRHFADKMNTLYRTAQPDTNLKRLRKSVTLSQREPAELSGVPLRTIQQYEQRQKNINKAQAASLVMLAKALCCEVDALLEKIE